MIIHQLNAFAWNRPACEADRTTTSSNGLTSSPGRARSLISPHCRVRQPISCPSSSSASAPSSLFPLFYLFCLLRLLAQLHLRFHLHFHFRFHSHSRFHFHCHCRLQLLICSLPFYFARREPRAAPTSLEPGERRPAGGSWPISWRAHQSRARAPLWKRQIGSSSGRPRADAKWPGPTLVMPKLDDHQSFWALSSGAIFAPFVGRARGQQQLLSGRPLKSQAAAGRRRAQDARRARYCFRGATRRSSEARLSAHELRRRCATRELDPAQSRPSAFVGHGPGWPRVALIRVAERAPLARPPGQAQWQQQINWPPPLPLILTRRPARRRDKRPRAGHLSPEAGDKEEGGRAAGAHSRSRAAMAASVARNGTGRPPARPSHLESFQLVCNK